jgi:hypothetical protein
MVIQTRRRDGRFIGIHIGAENVRRNFPPNQPSIELLLGHLHIHCELEPSFWHDHPDIYDQRLADWLESQCHRNRKAGGCVTLVMTEAGDRTYRIELPRTAPPPAPDAELAMVGKLGKG